jgi:succinate dehydrogenase / fumarate reductase cytochrome b subunit
MHQRPLSPHLQIYKWTWTMAMSVAHRLTGIALYKGMVLFVLWLISLAFCPNLYALFAFVFSSILGKIILFLFAWTFFHHALGGLRHIANDFGYGLDSARHRLAQGTAMMSLIMTLFMWFWL